jgi:hypothetical protein
MKTIMWMFGPMGTGLLAVIVVMPAIVYLIELGMWLVRGTPFPKLSKILLD